MSRILIVADKLEDRDFLCALLAGGGFTVEAAECGDAALTLARAERPDLVIVDVQATAADGNGLLRLWRGDARLRDVPFMVYGGVQAAPGGAVLAGDGVADAVIAKPSAPEKVFEVVREILGRSLRSAMSSAAPARSIHATDAVQRNDGNAFHRLEEKLVELEQANAALRKEIADGRKTEDALQMMSFSVDRAGDSIFWLSADGCILYANDSACADRGYTREELLGLTIFDLDPESGPDSWTAHFEELRRHGDLTLESRHRAKDGRIFPVEINASYVRIGGREINFASLRDITARKQAEAALRDSEIKLRRVIDGLGPNVLVGLLSTEGIVLEVNAPALAASGLVLADVIGKRVEQVAGFAYSPELQARLRAAVVRAAAGESERFDLQMQVPGVGLVWIDFAVNPVRDVDGRVIFLVPSGMVIHERKLVEEALRESGEHLRRTVQASNVGLWDWDIVNNRVVFSREWKRQIGYEEDELKSEVGEWERRLHPEDLAPTQERLDRYLARPEGHYEAEFRLRHRDGSWRWIFASAEAECDAAGRPVRMRGSHVDMTERKQAALAVVESEARFRSVLETVAVMAVMLDLDGRITLCSDHLLAITGWKREEVIGGDWFEIFMPVELRDQVFREAFVKLLRSGEQPRRYENEILTRAGERRMVAWSNTIVRDHAGGVIGVASLGEDITERRRAEERIRRLAAFPELNPNPVLEFAGDGALTYANAAAGAMAASLGFPGVAPLLPPETARFVASCLASGQPRLRHETRHHGHTLSWSFHPIGDQGVVHCYVGDITERLLLEEKLRQSQKMDAVGHLAGGVAHDFNNLLTIIQGNASLLSLVMDDPKQRTESITEISQAAERAAGLTRQLLAFSRRQVLQPRLLDLNEIVTSLSKLLKRILGEDVRLLINLHPSPLITRADAGMLDQVLMNLAVNARDAMPEGGRLTIETSAVPLGADDQSPSPDTPTGPQVCLRVSDTGCGIAAENLGRIFEPFFTTKEAGKGTGLGLATVFGIVKQHNGTVRASSLPGCGATFSVLLPATPVEAAAPAGQSAAAGLARGGNEALLVVEDEPSLRRFVQRVLERHGYRVKVVESGDEALRLPAHILSAIDLVLTDLVMPGGVSGRDLAVRLAERKPGTKIIYMSGYASDSTLRGLQLNEGVNFLPKPFTSAALLECVRSRLDGK